jgi:hypothetical protein
MMFNRKLISISIASALLTSSLAVSANTKDEEEKDSVSSWGQWAQNYATAAGGEFNTGALAFASLGQGETGNNSQNEAGFETPAGCEAGSFCGFTAFRAYASDYGEGRGVDGAEGIGVAYVDLQVEPDYFEDYSDYGDYGDYGMPFGIAQVKEKSPQKTGSFGIRGSGVEEVAIDGLTGGGGESSTRLSRSERTETSYSSFDVDYYKKNLESALIRGDWRARFTEYDVWESGIDGQFVGGITTDLAQLNDFVSNLNGVTATYRGYAFGWNSHKASRMDYLTIDFGQKTWDAQWNGGADGQSKQRMGGQDFRGVGFTVTDGSINGINLTAGSAQLSALDADSVTGSVNGALFGDAAQSVAGMIDIVKTSEGISEAHQAVFRGNLANNRLD